MTGRRRIGILGGTFDPIHVGHVAAALAARAALDLDHVLLVPSHVPPHRPAQPEASAFHRFAMASLATLDAPGLRASDIELGSAGPSYTSLTLGRFRDAGLVPSQLFFITGADAFAEVATWRDYPALLDAANFIVVRRAGRPAASMVEEAPALASRMRRVAPDGPRRDVRGTEILLLEAETPDVSATDIRQRRAQGRSITGLVPDAVERHILRHQLYVASDATSSAARATSPAAAHLHGQDPDS
jgi:nicotinate-nucleotide adenylyltransferase